MGLPKSVDLMIVGVVALFAVGILTAPSYAKIDPKTIVGIWLFDEGQGDEVKDGSGNGHTGVAADGKLVWGKGKFGNALEFGPNGGSRVHVKHNDALSLETYTLMFWIKTESNGNWQVIAEKQIGKEYITRNYMIEIRNGTDVAEASFSSSGVDKAGKATSTTVVADGTWHHVAATYDMKELKCYVDGQLEAIQPNSRIPHANTAPFCIGSRTFPEYPVNGLVDEVALSNVALEQEDIQIIMNEGLRSMTAVISLDKLSTTWGRIKAQY